MHPDKMFLDTEANTEQGIRPKNVTFWQATVVNTISHAYAFFDTSWNQYFHIWDQYFYIQD